MFFSEKDIHTEVAVDGTAIIGAKSLHEEY